MLRLLNGIRVLDASRWLAGAEATSLLADLGAEVIMLERPPEGNLLRDLHPRGLYSAALDRNKRSVAIDLGAAADRPLFERLVQSADVFVEASRPGVMSRLDADHAALRTLNPAIVYCSLTAWGQTGPYRDLPAHALSIESAAGLADISLDSPGTPRYSRRREAPNPLSAAAAHAALAVLAAVVQRERTGEGAFIDISIWDVAVAGQNKLNLTFLANTGELATGPDERGPRQGPYRTADGEIVFVDFVEPGYWSRFCEILGRPDLIDAPDGPAIAAVMSTRTRADWVAIAMRERLPITPVLTHVDLLTDPHARAREMFLDGAVRMLALPVKVAGQSFDATPPPELGADTAAIVAELFPLDARAPG